MTRLLLIRHGETTSNVAGSLDTGAPGAELTSLGRRQADGAASALAGQEFGSVHVSRLIRTRQTAEPIVRAHELTVATVPGLEEIGAGDFEMRTDTEAVKGYHSTVSHWVRGTLDTTMPGGESGHDFLKRYNEAIDAITAENRDVSGGSDLAVAISHGAAIRTWVANQIPGGDNSPVLSQLLHNTGSVTLESDAHGRWHLVQWHSEPIGGRFLEDEAAADPTGRPAGD